MAEKMAAICIRAALNLHADGSHPLLIIMFFVIARPQCIKSSFSLTYYFPHFPVLPYIQYISPCPTPRLCVRLAAEGGALQTLPGSKIHINVFRAFSAQD